MIISLTDAQKFDENITQEDLDGIEHSVRELTNNNFQNKSVRYHIKVIEEPHTIKTTEIIRGIRIGDNVELNYSRFNDGIYTVEEILEDGLKLAGEPLLYENTGDMMVTLVSYPPDIKRGVKKLIQYDKKMSGKIGIKSETISRMSTTYYDVNAAENIEGYPASLLSFLKKYERIRWG